MPDILPNINPIPTREEIRAREAARRKLLLRLDATRITVRTTAVEECRRLSPHEIGMLVALAELADPWTFPDKLKSAVDVVIAMVTSVSIVGMIYGVTLPEYVFWPHIGSYLAIWATLAAGGIIVHSRYQKNRYSLRVQESLLRVVCDAQDPAIFPVVLRMLNNWRGVHGADGSERADELYKAAARWLFTLDIAQIRSYASRLHSFYLFLSGGRAWDNPELTLRLLHILEEIGTASAIPVVEPLTRGFAPSTRHKEIRSAAQSCLSVLRQREQQSRQPEVLLRAACAPAVETETLLRGAAASPPAPDTLLRPMTAQNAPIAPEQLLRPSSSVE